MIIKVFVCVHIVTSFLLSINSASTPSVKLHANKLGKQHVSSTVRLIRSRGFLAVDHYVNVQNGTYTLNLVRATNPKINGGRGGLSGKEPLLFVHGIFVGANSFILNKARVEPQDYSDLNINLMSIDELRKLLQDNPASKSLVFTALNFGYEVWLLNRRPTLQSQLAHVYRDELARNQQPINGSINITEQEVELDSLDSFDKTQSLTNLRRSQYWYFSFDEQAQNDIPEVINYILNYTGEEKLIYVGHSAGSALLLMSLTIEPKLSEKISKAILWAPALYLKGNFHFVVKNFLNSVVHMLARLAIPLGPAYLVHPIESFVGTVCNSQLTQITICDPLTEFVLGQGEGQQMVENYNPDTRFFEATGSHEAAQLIQAGPKSKMHYFDTYDESKNNDLYGQPNPPVYDVSQITLKTMSFWTGMNDIVVPKADVDRIVDDLIVPTNIHSIGGNGILFNHNAFYTHKNVGNLLIIPCLKTIATVRQSSSA